jgi:predicted AlkP superfamily pyrophosphatase or phosphodiesterase
VSRGCPPPIVTGLAALPWSGYIPTMRSFPYGSALRLVLMLAVPVMPPSAAVAQEDVPALVVVITVDQLRGDYLDRYAPNLTGGLHRFLEQSAYFPAAQQDHANTSTAPGHSTVLSGRVPARTNILSNDYGVPDASRRLIAGATSMGASPFRFRGTTLYDWMLAADPATRALSVSRKDRGAILTIGAARTHVYWWANARFTTSTWYRNELPEWVSAWNDAFDPDAWSHAEWTPLLPDDAYPEPDDQPWEGAGRGTVFPHRLTAVEQLIDFPWMDSLTLDLALTGARALELGRRDGTDLLSIGLSTLDAIGHHFGPGSRELHDMVVRIDHWLGHFMSELERHLPPGEILYVLTSDHGVQGMPEQAIAQGTDHAGRVALTPVMRRVVGPLQERFQHRFGFEIQNGIVLADTAALRARGVDVSAVGRELERELALVPGVARVWTPQSLAAAPADDASARLYRRGIPPSHGWLAAAEVADGWIMTTSRQATHGSLVAADRSVPIAFLGTGIPALRSERAVATVDIAPTLAALLGIQPTEELDGTVLSEVVVSQ